MNSAFSVLPALLGGLTSFLTSYVMVKVEARQARAAVERAKREDLYGTYMTELAALFAAALRARTRR